MTRISRGGHDSAIAAASTEGRRHAAATLMASAGRAGYGALGMVLDIGRDEAAHLAAIDALTRLGTTRDASHDSIRPAVDRLIAVPAPGPPGVTVLLLRGGLAWCVHAGPGSCLLRRGAQWFEMTARPDAASEVARAHAWPHPMALETGDRFVLATGATVARLGVDRLQELAIGGTATADAHAIVAAAAGRGDSPRAGVVIADVAAATPPP